MRGRVILGKKREGEGGAGIEEGRGGKERGSRRKGVNGRRSRRRRSRKSKESRKGEKGQGGEREERE